MRPYNGDLRAPLRHLLLSDDRIVPPGAEIDLDSFYPNAIKRIDRLTPGQLGVQAVDHFGFFRKRVPPTAWADAADWLAAHTS